VVHKVDMVVVGRKGGRVVGFHNAEQVLVVLRDLRLNFCAFGGERVEARSKTVPRQRVVSGISEALGERAGVL